MICQSTGRGCLRDCDWKGHTAKRVAIHYVFFGERHLRLRSAQRLSANLIICNCNNNFQLYILTEGAHEMCEGVCRERRRIGASHGCSCCCLLLAGTLHCSASNSETMTMRGQCKEAMPGLRLATACVEASLTAAAVSTSTREPLRPRRADDEASLWLAQRRRGREREGTKKLRGRERGRQR